MIKTPSALNKLGTKTDWSPPLHVIVLHINECQSKLFTAICDHMLFSENTLVLGEYANDLLKVLIAAAGPTRFQVKALNTHLSAIETRDDGAHASAKRGAERDGVNTGACFDFRKWRCARGESCEFSHEKDATIKTCYDFSKGKCLRGDSCFFAHDTGTDTGA